MSFIKERVKPTRCGVQVNDLGRKRSLLLLVFTLTMCRLTYVNPAHDLLDAFRRIGGFCHNAG